MLIRPYTRDDLAGVLELCEAEGWPSFSEDAERAHRVLTAPGVTTMVAVDGDEFLGFAQLQSDGEIQAHLSLIVLDPRARRQGLGRALIAAALEWAGGERVDLVTDSAEDFYAALFLRQDEWSSPVPVFHGAGPLSARCRLEGWAAGGVVIR